MLLEETNFTYKETQQVVREIQLVELSTAGLYQIQQLQISLNLSELNEEAPPMFAVEWGGRETGPLSLPQLGIGYHVSIVLRGVVNGLSR